MNSKDYRNIREAYLQVYAPQELTEEQVWEEVEYWVNSLLEEGYDLSDYTWEEMYESYLGEMGQGMPAEFGQPTPKAKPLPAGNIQVQGPRTIAGTSSVTRYRSSSDGKIYKNKFDAIAARASRLAALGKSQSEFKADLNAKFPVKFPKSEKPTTPTPATPAPRSTSPTPARPTATPSTSGPKSTPTTSTTPTKPAIGTTPGGTKFERRTPTSAELSAAQDARAAGKGEEGAIKAGVEASKPATPAPNPVKADVPGFALGGKPPTSTDSGESDKLKIKKSDVTSGFDMFDVVKGYLIGEGYADTEEAALAIMANMSEDWKYSILSEAKKTTADDMAKGDLYSAMFRRDKKVKGAKYDNPSANKYLNMKNSKDRQKEYDDDMGNVHTDRRPSR